MPSHAEELIQFLDEHWSAVMAEQTASQPLGATPDESLKKLEELRRSFLDELARKTREQLIAAVVEAMDEQDQSRPFNRFGTDADYEHFGRCAFLTADEAAALSLGKDPRFVKWSSVQPYLGKSRFAFEYAKCLDLLERAIIWEELPQRFSPLKLLTWAHEYRVPVPQAFIQSTFVRGEPIWYWHDLCDALSAQLSAVQSELESATEAVTQLQAERDDEAQRTFEEWLANLEAFEALTSEHDSKVSALSEDLTRANEDNVLLRQQLAAAETASDAISTSERKSLLAIALVTAIDGLGYNPQDKKSPIPKQVADAAQLIGLSLTDDTVRKYLKEGTRLKGFVAPDTLAKKPKSGTEKPKSV